MHDASLEVAVELLVFSLYGREPAVLENSLDLKIMENL